MTVSSTDRVAGPFIGNGVNVDAPFAFKVFKQEELLVTEAVIATGVETVKVLGTDYTVTLNPDQEAAPGGVVHRLTPLPATLRLVITSDVEATQLVEVTNSGGFYPEVFNNEFDKLTILIQQLEERVGRAFMVDITTDPPVDTSLPAGPNMFLRYNDTATAFVLFSLEQIVAAADQVDNDMAPSTERAPSKSAVKAYIDAGDAAGAGNVQVLKDYVDAADDALQANIDSSLQAAKDFATAADAALKTYVDSQDAALKAYVDSQDAAQHTYTDTQSNLRLLKSANLSDVASPAAARTNIGAAASGPVTTSGLTMSTDMLLGRTSPGSGSVEQISMGAGLSLAAGVLSATGGSGASDTPANPTALVGTTAVNGASLNYMRADAAPAIDLAMSPAWTGAHKYRGYTSTTSVSPIQLLPTDYGAGKPGLFFTKASTANIWYVQVYDGANNAGQLYLAVDQVVHSKDTYTTGNAIVGGGTVQIVAPAGVSAGLYFDAPINQYKTLWFRTGTSLRWALGSGVGETGSGDAGSDFSITRYSDAGAVLGYGLYISRASGAATFSGSVTAPSLAISGPANTGRNLSYFTGASYRWSAFISGDPETGSNAGSNYVVGRYTDAGAWIGPSLSIARATGDATFSNAVVANGFIYAMAGYIQIENPSNCSMQFRAPSGTEKAIYFMGGATKDKARWCITAGAAAETGGNVGAELGIVRFNDAGAYIDTPLYISRTNGQVQFANAPYFGGAGQGPGFAEPGLWRGQLAVPGLATGNEWSGGGYNSFRGYTYQFGILNVGTFNNMSRDLAYLGVNPDGGAYAATFMLGVNGAHNTVYIQNDRTDSNPMVFHYGSTMVGAILQNGTTVTYSSASDYRLKENVTPLADDAVAAIRALNPVTFTWKSRPELGPQPGFLAHEVQAIRPHAVDGEKDGMEPIGTLYVTEEVEVDGKMVAQEIAKDTDSVFIHNLPEGKRWEQTGERLKPQMMDPSKLIPDLVATIQVLLDRVDALEAQLGAAR